MRPTGVMPKGLSVRRYAVSVRTGVPVIGEAPIQTEELVLASVISMLDSLHLAKVVEGDLAWP